MKTSSGHSKTGKDSKSKVKTLDEVFPVSDAEILSNWTSLASFIKNVEGAKWDTAKSTALKLLDDDKAAEYVSTQRKKYTGVSADTDSKSKEPTQQVLSLKLIHNLNKSSLLS